MSWGLSLEQVMVVASQQGDAELMDGLPAHDVALLLDEAAGVMVRSGQHCVHSWFADRGHPQGSLRASAYLYNNAEDVRRFVDPLTEIVHTLS